MTRPTVPTLAAGTAGWDTFLNDLKSLIFNKPFAIYTVVDVATLTAAFTPNLFEDCLALVQTPTRALYVSDSTAWVPL